MTPEQERLCALIDGHCEAMKAQVVDPSVKLEYLENGHWLANSLSTLLSDATGDRGQVWHRLAPAPRLIPLDQSDFLGESRVTHIKDSGIIYAVSVIASHAVGGGPYRWDWGGLMHSCECSRDYGATWSRCEKPAP